jgi:hypothetical protein
LIVSGVARSAAHFDVEPPGREPLNLRSFRGRRFEPEWLTP